MINVAILDNQDVVVNVIVCEDDYAASSNEILCNDSTKDPQIGGTYDRNKEKFVSIKPHASWTLDEDSLEWNPPSEKPTDGFYWWNEPDLAWVKLVPQE